MLSMNTQCTPKLFIKLSVKCGNKYKHWFNRRTFTSCIILAKNFLIVKGSKGKANFTNFDVIVLTRPMSLKTDPYILTNTKETLVFKFISFVKFNHTHLNTTYMLDIIKILSLATVRVPTNNC